MSQSNYMQVIDPRIEATIAEIDQLKRTINDVWEVIRDKDAKLREFCGCHTRTWRATSPNGLAIDTGSVKGYCDYHKPVMMSEARA